ncbi:MAG: TetR/AcrR family transcriptional regulator [Phycisphaerales bacterium JB040]
MTTTKTSTRRDDLIQAANRLFMAHGYHATGIDAILKEAGVSRMTLYNHFKSKDELILASLRHRHEQLLGQIEEALSAAPPDPLDRLLAIVDFHARWITSPEFHGCAFVNAAAEFPDADCAIRKLIASHKRDVVALMAREARSAGLDRPEALAERVHLVLEGAISASLSTTAPCAMVPNALPPDEAASHARAACEILIERAFESAPARTPDAP